MQLLVIQRILGLLLILFSSALLPPILVGLYYGDGAVDAFGQAFFIILISGLPSVSTSMDCETVISSRIQGLTEPAK